MNNHVGTRASRSRQDQWAAYEKLHPQLRAALQASLNDWSAADMLTYSKKHGWAKALAWIEYGEAQLIKRGWGKGIPSTAAKPVNVPILRK